MRSEQLRAPYRIERSERRRCSRRCSRRRCHQCRSACLHSGANAVAAAGTATVAIAATSVVDVECLGSNNAQVRCRAGKGSKHAPNAHAYINGARRRNVRAASVSIVTTLARGSMHSNKSAPHRGESTSRPYCYSAIITQGHPACHCTRGPRCHRQPGALPRPPVGIDSPSACARKSRAHFPIIKKVFENAVNQPPWVPRFVFPEKKLRVIATYPASNSSVPFVVSQYVMPNLH